MKQPIQVDTAKLLLLAGSIACIAFGYRMLSIPADMSYQDVLMQVRTGLGLVLLGCAGGAYYFFRMLR